MRTNTPIQTSIVIPTHNQFALLKPLIAGLIDTAASYAHPLELIIVDNRSNEAELLDYLRHLAVHIETPFARVKVIRYPHKFNFAAINNTAVKHSRASFLCFLNNDIEIIDHEWLNELHVPMQYKKTGCVGAMLYYPDNTIQHAGVYLDPVNIAGHLYKNSPRRTAGRHDFLLSAQPVNAVTAACSLIRRSVFDEVGGFDEQFAVAFNDVDLCLRVQQAGYTNFWTPHAQLYHHESKSRGQSHQRTFLQRLKHNKEVRLMQQRWQEQLRCEPHWATHVKPGNSTSPKKVA